MSNLRILTLKNVRRYGLVVLAVGALQGCANLDAVREFSKTASSEVASYGDAGRAVLESAKSIEPYRIGTPEPKDQAETRRKHVATAIALQASAVGYFSTLAKLAGEDSFSLDAELDAVQKGLESLPADVADPAQVKNAISLVKTVQKYALAHAQSTAIKALVSEGGPVAMNNIKYLEAVAVSWRGVVENDSKLVANALSNLSMARDTPPLLSMLARDRLQQHQLQYEQALKRIDVAIGSLRKINTAHETMALNLNTLDSKELQSLLKAAVADLKAAKSSLAALR